MDAIYICDDFLLRTHGLGAPLFSEALPSLDKFKMDTVVMCEQSVLLRYLCQSSNSGFCQQTVCPDAPEPSNRLGGPSFLADFEL
jgi:hypothetical protein